MKALSVVYGGALHEAAYQPVFSGKQAAALALERGGSFPNTQKTVLLLEHEQKPPENTPQTYEILRAEKWTKKNLLDKLARLSEGFDLTYFAWADCPFLDPDLAGAVADRFRKYAAEYAYADGYPYGLAPEVLGPGLAGILSNILGENDGPIERDLLFSVIQKDINAFDIETELSPIDLRRYRLSFTADSKRNLLLLSRFKDAGFSGYRDAARLIEERPELLRTLPNFYPIQVSSECPQSCCLCPYPRFRTDQKRFFDPSKFSALLDKISDFSGDGVIDLSLWGEVSLHPEKLNLIQNVLSRPNLSLIIETSGIGWKTGDIETLADSARNAPLRTNRQSPLSWIVSLDAQDPQRYQEIRGAGYPSAMETAKTLLRFFPKDAYVQAVRVKGFEDDIERFYRYWKEESANIIIQKYDYFCGLLPELRAADLSPVKRHPCWHIMRDMPILLDGSVPLCREEVEVLAGRGREIGNVFSESLESLWERGKLCYREQCGGAYTGICAGCDEYYTYNF